jgi:hypothetical protein
MRLANIAISVETAARLYEIGIRADSILYWFQELAPQEQTLFETGITQKTMPFKLHIAQPSKENKNIFKEFPAPTCQELGEMLPGFIQKDGITYFLRFERTGKEWKYMYQDYDNKMLCNVLGKNEVEARAALLTLILWQKFIDITDTIIK